MDNELRQHLEGMESRLRENTDAVVGKRIDAVEARLRENIDGMEAGLRENIDAVVGKRIDAMEARLRENIDAVEARLRENIDGVEARLREHTEVVETRLLSEFWKWAKTTDARYRQHQGTVTTLDERVSLVEERITALESGGRAGRV